jgi:hypothetical protein
MISAVVNFLKDACSSKYQLFSKSFELEEIIAEENISFENAKKRLEKWQIENGNILSDEKFVNCSQASDVNSKPLQIYSSLRTSLIENEHCPPRKNKKPCCYFFEGTDKDISGHTPLTLASKYGNICKEIPI